MTFRTTKFLKENIKNNRIIVGETIADFLCMGSCDKSFNGKVLSADSHKPWCLWNYYVKCPSCGYENNLAKCNETQAGLVCTHPCECAKLA